jgi:hypothetical protein
MGPPPPSDLAQIPARQAHLLLKSGTAGRTEPDLPRICPSAPRGSEHGRAARSSRSKSRIHHAARLPGYGDRIRAADVYHCCPAILPIA